MEFSDDDDLKKNRFEIPSAFYALFQVVMGCVLPANIDLSMMELQLVSTMNRERVLSTYINSMRDKGKK